MQKRYLGIHILQIFLELESRMILLNVFNDKIALLFNPLRHVDA